MKSAATVLVYNTDGHVLVVPRRGQPGRVSMPGGKLHEGEAPIEGALRELWEETGLAPSSQSLSVVIAASLDDAEFYTTGFLSTLVLSPDLPLRAEAPGLEPAWVSEAELLARTICPIWTRAMLELVALHRREPR